MRVLLVPSFAGLCALGLGCGPQVNIARTLLIEPIHYCDSADKVVEWTRDCKLAKEAWERIEKENPSQTFSPDYADGFKFAFADYLYAGGDGTPPVLPPRSYWKPKYETPVGVQAINEWYAGFRHGAAAAHASGYRTYVTVPTWVQPQGRGAPRYPEASAGPAPAAPTGPEALPTPRITKDNAPERGRPSPPTNAEPKAKQNLPVNEAAPPEKGPQDR